MEITQDIRHAGKTQNVFEGRLMDWAAMA